MAHTDDKPKKSEWIRRTLEFIFTFENTRGEVLHHDLFSADSFNVAPGEFYQFVERLLELHNFPGVTVYRQPFSEGGLLSDDRMYLRTTRERLFVDTCAAPFGDHYFFSIRIVHVRALVRLWHILAAIGLLAAVGFFLIIPLGFTYAMIALVGLLFAVVNTLRNAGNSPFDDLDTLLMKIPVVSTIYQNWFRVDTYYREDTRTMYRTLVPSLIQKAADEACAANGIKLVRCYEYPPVLPGLWLQPPAHGGEPQPVA